MQSLNGGDAVNRARASRFWGVTVLESATRPCLRSRSDANRQSIPVQIAPHNEIPPKTHGLVADSKTVASRINRQPPENLALTTLKDSSEGFPFLLQSAQSEG